MPNAAAEPLIDRFRDTIEELVGSDAGKNARFGVAVSGGPDSMALLWLTHSAFPGRALAATVDHGLRPEARREAEMVAAWCAGQGIDHDILTLDEPITGNIQSEARRARYAQLHRWCQEKAVDWLLTAHHANDQMETMLMRLNRASGVSGLSGVRARNGIVLRPLLQWSRRELEQVVEAQSLPHVHDPSNDDSRFDRVAMRKHLKGVDWLDPMAFARSAEALDDAQDALEWMVGQLENEYVRMTDEGHIMLTSHDFPRELQRRLLLRMLTQADPAFSAPRGATLDRALSQLLAGEKAMIGDWHILAGASWVLMRAPPRSLV
ncbi:MAG: tRNA lysidine(34) synthetase TilS [Sphingobium sp.]|nr:tRNA lysidine(34) synthetase TilS [Sphingobium sp.]MCP5398638.1 tRNA lysidine(34) synthetase TilS [Sphingomonas sp.]